MNTRLKLIAAVLGFAVAATSIGDVSAKTSVAKPHAVAAKPHAVAAKAIARTPHRLHLSKRIAVHGKIAHRAPKITHRAPATVKVVKPLGTKTLGTKKVVAAKRVAKKVLVKKAFGPSKVLVAKHHAAKRHAGKVFAKRALHVKKIAHAAKRPLAQKQAMLHRASVKKSVVR